MTNLILTYGPPVRRAVLLLVAGGLALFVLPGYVHDEFDLPKLALLLTGTAVAGGIRLAELAGGRSGRHLRLVLLPGLFLAVPLTLSWLASPYKEWALIGQYWRYAGLVPYLAVILFGVLLADAFLSRPRQLVTVLALSGAIVGGYTLIQMLGLDPLPWPGTEVPNVSTLGNANFSGAFMAISLPATLYLWSRPGRARYLGMAATVLAAFGCFVVSSQGAWGAAFAGVAVALAFHFGALGRVRTALLVAGGVAAVATVGVVLVHLAFPDLPAGYSVHARSLYWRNSARMTVDHALVGRGPNAFALDGIRYRTAEEAVDLGSLTADEPHSVLLAFSANAGLIGALGFLALAAWILRKGLLLDHADALGGAFFGAATAYLVQSLVSIDQLSLRGALWIAVAGLAVRARRTDVPEREFSRRSRLLTKIVVYPAAAGVIAFAVATSFNLVRADHLLERGLNLMERGRLAAGLASFQRASEIRDEPQYRRIHIDALGWATLDRPGRAPSLIAKMEAQASYLDDLPDAKGIFALARNYHYWGSFSPEADAIALELFREGLVLDRYNVSARIDASEVLTDLGRPDEGLELLEPLVPEVTQRGGYPEFWGAMALARLSLGDHGGAEVALAEGSSDCRGLIATELLNVQADPSYEPPPGTALRLHILCSPGLFQLLLDRLPPEARAAYA